MDKLSSPNLNDANSKIAKYLWLLLFHHTKQPLVHITYLIMEWACNIIQSDCKESARPIRSSNDYKRPKTLISSKAKKLNLFIKNPFSYLNDTV